MEADLLKNNNNLVSLIYCMVKTVMDCIALRIFLFHKYLRLSYKI